MRALALGRQQGALFWELRTGTSLARLWRNQGEGGKAQDQAQVAPAQHSGQLAAD